MSKYPRVFKKMKTTIEKKDICLMTDVEGSSRSAAYLEPPLCPSDPGVIPPLI